ncbi:ABC transporter ATP-binding protein [Kineococcus sp. SYSU DK006]|uniref:ABC transporter ATP-binding protein n=1 Tax=Kineococcus sp. SYSU DK006 TaxID=3383127 RepID=UPI003D7D602B
MSADRRRELRGSRGSRELQRVHGFRRVRGSRGAREARGRRERSALRRTAALVAPHTRGSRTLAGGGLLALLAEVAFRLAEPWPLKFVLDTVVPAAAGGRPAPDAVRWIVLAGVALVLIAIGRAAAAYLSTVAFASVGARTTTRLRAAVNERLLHAAPAFHAATRTGDLVTRVVGDVGRVQEAAITAGLPLLGSVLTFTAMASVMLVLDPLLALAVLAVVPLLLLTGRRSSERITGASREQRTREGALAADASETFAGIGFLQAYDLHGERTRAFAAADDGTSREGVLARRLAAGLERRVDVLVGAATALVLVVGAHRVLGGALGVGDLVVFLTYLKAAFKPVRDLAKHTGRIARAAASGERVADTLEQAVPLAEDSGARRLHRLHGYVRLEGVTVERRPGCPVLHEAHLDVRPGERVALVGASGSGKSTTLQLLLRLVDPVAGRLLLDGHDARRLRRADVRRSTAVVLQEPVLFADTVRENVRLGRPGAGDADVEAAVRAVGAEEFVLALPQGYDTPVTERGGSLSGGQRQRLAIARALLRDPGLVLLDEPTTGLDGESARTVLAALERLSAGRTTLLVTHDASLLGWCDRIVELHEGRFTERTGTADPSPQQPLQPPPAVAR